MMTEVEKDDTALEVPSLVCLELYCSHPYPNTRACLQSKEEDAREMSSADMLLSVVCQGFTITVTKWCNCKMYAVVPT